MYEIEDNIPMLSVPTAKQMVVTAARELYTKGGITKTLAAKKAIYNDNTKVFAYTVYANAIQYIVRRI